jgi:hypothetical protein
MEMEEIVLKRFLIGISLLIVPLAYAIPDEIIVRPLKILVMTMGGGSALVGTLSLWGAL